MYNVLMMVQRFWHVHHLCMQYLEDQRHKGHGWWGLNNCFLVLLTYSTNLMKFQY